MKKELSKEIEIPEGLTIILEENLVTAKGPEGEVSRKFNFGRLNYEIKDNKFILKHEKATKTEKKMMNTISSHIENMIRGVKEKFVYELKICFSHFPFTVKKEGNKAIIKNFLGEKINREARLMEETEIEIGKEIIIVKSSNKELAGQTAANFEAATKIRGRDKRIFQDGIYIIKKNGKEM
jgi:large subunit ribosomal protein L6